MSPRSIGSVALTGIDPPAMRAGAFAAIKRPRSAAQLRWMLEICVFILLVFGALGIRLALCLRLLSY